MDNLFASISNQALGFLTGALVFFITLFLVARQMISFGVTFILLIFALAVGISIANQDIIRDRFIGNSRGETTTTEKSHTR